MSAEHTGHQHTAVGAEAETTRGRFRARQAAAVMVSPHLARLRFENRLCSCQRNDPPDKPAAFRVTNRRVKPAAFAEAWYSPGAVVSARVRWDPGDFDPNSGPDSDGICATLGSPLLHPWGRSAIHGRASGSRGRATLQLWTRCVLLKWKMLRMPFPARRFLRLAGGRDEWLSAGLSP